MKKLEIKSIIRKEYRPQSNKNLRELLTGNILKQNFKSKSISEKIIGDITYIQTKDYGWCYLASFLDLYTNEIIGCKFSTSMTTELVICALNKANNRNKISGAIIYSDQRSQYTSKLYTDHILSLDCILSYSRKGNPYDNVCTKYFHSIIRKELIYQRKIRAFEEIKESLFEYIEGWYNSRRIQKSWIFISF